MSYFYYVSASSVLNYVEGPGDSLISDSVNDSDECCDKAKANN